MPDIQEFKDATILQNVDVSEIITSLALSVVKAQSKLDKNSFDQLTRFGEYKFEGKSLLELGFIPAFYNFSEATFSTSMSIKMVSQEELGANVNFIIGANVDVRSNRQFETNMEGNTCISATMKSVQLPEEFKTFIKQTN